MLGEILGPLFDDLVFHEGYGGSRGAEQEMAASSIGSTKEVLQ